MSKLQTIYLDIKDDDDGVYAISLVGDPAIEENFIALSKEHVEFKAIDDERKIVVGFALVPEKEIYRKISDKKSKHFGKEFNIKFSKETVAKTAELFMKNLHGNNFTSEHQKPVSGASVIESWMVEDPKNDKSNIYNLKAKGGEWVIMVKLYNEEEYQKAKDGTYKGFSIEAMYDGFDQLEASTELTSDDNLIETIKQILNKA